MARGARPAKSAALFLAWISFVSAQAPSGAIAGVVRDTSGAAVSSARVEAMQVNVQIPSGIQTGSAVPVLLRVGNTRCDEVGRKGESMKTNVVFLLLALAVGQTSKAAEQSPGTFTATGNMTTGRFSHTATLLADGRVLIAGGVDNKTPSAELYDPRTGKFTATGNMTTPRRRHTATLLPDGRVLIAGGIRTNSNEDAFGEPLASAELYDPRTGTFSGTGEMSTARSDLTATLLNSGKVLIAGGFYPGQGYCCFPVAAELYDPDTGTFAATGNMISEWADTPTLLPNGKVLVTKNDLYGPGPHVTSAELYDPSTGTFTFAGYATTNHTVPTVTLLMNGKVLIAGGDFFDGDGGTFIAEGYDPAAGAFSRTGNMVVGREQHTATLLPDGSVLLAGGDYKTPSTAELYDPRAGTFTATGNMTAPLMGHTATLLGDGTVLVAGGFAPWPALTSNANPEIYHPAVLVPSPQLFSVSGDGRGQGAILHANTPQLASPVNPAAVGEALEIYLTGIGDGSQIPPQVSIGGRMAEVLWFGDAPGYAGLNQINVRVPAGVTPGSVVPVRLNYLGRPSNEVTIGVR